MNTDTPRTPNVPLRVAILGGADYDEGAFEDWLYKLHAKHPTAIIITGTAVGKNVYAEELNAKGKKELLRKMLSAEQMAASLMPGLGHTVETPDMKTPTAVYLAGGSDLQAGWILNGQWELYRTEAGTLDHRWITRRPDIIVAVGNLKSSRAAAAHEHWKKMDAWREPENRRTFVSVAAPAEKKKEKVYKAKKKNEQLAA